MTTIRITALDRQLILLDRVTVASGDTNTVRVQISTDASWEGYLCEAVFFREGDRDLVLTAPLDRDGACAVPAQLLTDPCTLYIGLRGQRESMTATGELTQRKTSALVSYRVVEGIPAEAGTALVNPTAATADEESVLAGKTFYAGDQSTIRTGTIRTYEEGDPVLLMPYVESDPNVPAWAKKPNPPTAAEVGAAPAVESSEHPGCYFRTANGVTEWVNPPAMLGIEYRTTERYMGKPVYIKAVDCGEMPSAGTHKNIVVAYGLPYTHKIVGMECIFESEHYGEYALKRYCVNYCTETNNTGEIKGIAWAYSSYDSVNVTIKALGDITNYTAVATVKYVK